MGKYVAIFGVTITLILAHACSKAEFSSSSKGTVRGILGIGPGDPIDLPPGVPSCTDNPNLGLEGYCLIFKDSFERDEIVENEDFRWSELIDDAGRGAKNVSVEIEGLDHLGNIYDGDKSLLYRGRQGGSTHSVFLTSADLPINLSELTHVVVQFHWVPLSLEEELIRMDSTGEKKHESVQVEACVSSDADCAVQNGSVGWQKYSCGDAPVFGQDLNIRNYGDNDWELCQVVIDLNQIRDFRDNFVFKITASMDEGYFGNDRDNEMEDGIVLDDVIVVAVKAPQEAPQPNND